MIRTNTSRFAAAAAALGAAQALAQAPMIEGEVRKIDAAQGRVTLRHGEIQNLDMPPMSMVFEVADPARLATLKPGDKVRFAAEKIGGKFTVTAIEVVR